MSFRFSKNIFDNPPPSSDLDESLDSSPDSDVIWLNKQDFQPVIESRTSGKCTGNSNCDSQSCWDELKHIFGRPDSFKKVEVTSLCQKVYICVCSFCVSKYMKS